MDQDGTPYSSKYYRQNVGVLTLSLQRPVSGEGDPGDFVLRLAGEYGVSGCPKISPLSYSMEMQGGTVVVKLGDYTVDLRNLPQAPEYQCPRVPRYPSAEMVLNARMLAADGVNQVRFESPGRFDYYDIKQGEGFIQLVPGPLQTPKSKIRPLQSDYTKNALKLWFYPSGTLVLKVDGSDDDGSLAKAVADFAAQQKLVPLETVLKGFTSPLADPYSFYYVDQSNTLSHQPGIENGVSVGTINLSTKVEGYDGEETVNRPVTVVAHTPGANE